MWIRRLIIRLLLPIVWSFSRRRVAQALTEFSITEVDSAWQSLYAMKFVKDPKVRSKLFQHALEEIHHGALFKKLATKYSDAYPSGAIADRTLLFKKDKGESALVEFYAAEAVGETNVRNEFSTYANAAPMEDIRELFIYVKKDETGHAIYTHGELNRLTNHQWLTRQRLLFQVRLSRIYQAWLNFGNSLGHFVPGILLGALYLIFGLPGRLVCRRRMASSYEFEQRRIEEEAQSIDRRKAAL